MTTRSDRLIISGSHPHGARVPSAFRRRAVIGVIGAALVTGALAVELAGRRGQFVDAIRAAPIWILSLAVPLQLVALIARTEAWHVCVRATGATVDRRRLFRAAGVGCLASVLNGSLCYAAWATADHLSRRETALPTGAEIAVIATPA